MVKLILTLNNTLLSEYPLDKERVTIGRRPTNSIYIDDLAVSGEHAAITKIGNDYYVEDLASTNGTMVNAQLIKKNTLQSGDIIEFGKYQLKYINESVFANSGLDSSGTGSEKTMMTRPSELNVEQQKTRLAAAPTSAISSTSRIVSPMIVENTFNAIGRIRVLNGSSVGRELVLNKTLTTLGKTGVQVAVITKRLNGYFITHVEGKEFPIVNSNSTGAQAIVLNDHDVIELAGIKMKFYLDKI